MLAPLLATSELLWPIQGDGCISWKVNVEDAPSPQGWSLRELFARSDLATSVSYVVSSFDANLVFFGWYHGLTTSLFDGMLDFWAEEAISIDLEDAVAKMREARTNRDHESLCSIVEQLNATHVHATVLASHLLATCVFVRTSSGPRAEHLLARFAPLAKVVHSVGALCNEEEHLENKDLLLISLSGLLCPVATFEQCKAYAKAVLSFVASEIVPLLPQNMRYVVVAHPDLCPTLLAHLGTNGNNIKYIKVQPAMDPWAFLNLIRQSVALLSPPGLSAIEEAAALGVPMICLPEQNVSHAWIMSDLWRSGFFSDGEETYLSVFVPPEVANGDEDERAPLKLKRAGQSIALEDTVEDTTLLLHASTAVLECTPGTLEADQCRAVAKFVLRMLQDDSARSSCAERQKEAVRIVCGGFAGARRVAESLVAWKHSVKGSFQED